ncbi:MAG: hypothetical protein H7070_13855 [Saprospiraceae bacterium]|nr:hypothetical protein [Pyrinomonadaceae bacterium]
MIRKILAVIAGIITAVVLFMVSQAVGGAIYGSPQMPEGGGMPDPAVMAAYIANLPVGAFVVLALGYIIGSFAGGFVARKISQSDSLVVPVVIGAVLTLFWILNITMVTHPILMTVIGFFCYIPFTILGHRAAK